MDDDKVSELEKKIARFKKVDEKFEQSSEGKQHSLPLRMVTDLGAAIFVGFMIGYGLDALFGTDPVFMLIFLFIGIAAGFLNVYRAAMKEGD